MATPFKVTKTRKLPLSKYIETNWILKINNETLADRVSEQAYDAFRDKVNDKYLPKYEKANKIVNPSARRKALLALKRQVYGDIHGFFDSYRKVTLSPLADAVLRTRRMQNQFLNVRGSGAVRKGKKREKVTQVRDRAKTAKLQLRKADGSKDRRHQGSPNHMVNKFVAGYHREAKRVVDQKSAQRAMGRTKGWFKTNARTMAQGTISTADQQAISETFQQYRYVAIIDEATTDICTQLDGEVFDADDLDNVRPPQHFNCRSEIQPVTGDKPVDKALERASKERFHTWLRKQPEEVQRSIVPKGKFSQWKDGKYSPPPQWRAEKRYFVDKDTGLPVVKTKDNQDRLVERLKVIDVEFEPKQFR